MSALIPQYDSLFVAFQQALAGRYSIEREIGRGGMGVVYLAKEVHLDRPVAIKLLPPDKAKDAGLRDRFLREARMAAKLSHPNIVPIHAVEEGGDFVYYAMAYVEGVTLADRVQSRGPVSGSDGVRILREVAWALAYAHENGLVHRDVKPDNILLETSTGRVLVVDFGIAAALSEVPGTGVTGTPEFMSPEQALGTQVDARSDLYSLGVTGFYAFSGRLPFVGNTATEILAKHVVEPPPSLAALGLAVPRRVATLVDRCLAKKPEDRPQSAHALAEQLGAAMERRRELPAALRAFVKRTGRLTNSGSILYLTGVPVAMILAGLKFGQAAALTTLATGMIVIPFGALIQRARRLIQQGFSQSDLAPAFKAEIEITREERATEHSLQATRVEGLLARVAQIAIPVGLVTLVPVLSALNDGASYRWYNIVGLVSMWGIGVGIPAGIAWLVLVQRRKDIDTEFWAKVWTGRTAAGLFAIARRLVPARSYATSMTHRPTELALGLAAAELFDALPKETRAALGDVPGVLHKLEHDAQQLRALYDESQDALSAAGQVVAGEASADVRATRDAVGTRLKDAIGALETIRLNLLRLHAGAGSLESFTTHLGLALDISADVDRLVRGHAEVNRFLSPFPHRPAATPA